MNDGQGRPAQASTAGLADLLEFFLCPVRRTSPWAPARERVATSLRQAAIAPLLLRLITSAPRTTGHHFAGSAPTGHCHLRQPSQPEPSTNPTTVNVPLHLLLELVETDYARTAVASGSPAARQAGIEASSVRQRGRNCRQCHLPESIMSNTSRGRPSAPDSLPRPVAGELRPPEDAPVTLPQTAAHASWIPLRPTIRRHQLRQIVPLADTTIYDMERRGEFPRRVHLTSRCVVWNLQEVEAWIESRRQASDLAQIKLAPPPDVRQRRSRPVRSAPAS